MHPIQKTVHCKTSQHWDKEDISKLLNRKKKKKVTYTDWESEGQGFELLNHNPGYKKTMN